MAKTIYKYLVREDGKITVPKESKFLCVQMQNDKPYVWVLHDIEKTLETKQLSIYGTGHELPDNPGEYIGTWQDGPYVFHLFNPSQP